MTFQDLKFHRWRCFHIIAVDCFWQVQKIEGKSGSFLRVGAPHFAADQITQSVPISTTTYQTKCLQSSPQNWCFQIMTPTCFCQVQKTESESSSFLSHFAADQIPPKVSTDLYLHHPRPLPWLNKYPFHAQCVLQMRHIESVHFGQVIKDWIGSPGCLWPWLVETSLIKYLPARPVTLYIHHMLHPQVCSIYWQWTIQNREYITELAGSSELNNGENGRNLTIQAFTVSAQYARIIKS